MSARLSLRNDFSEQFTKIIHVVVFENANRCTGQSCAENNGSVVQFVRDNQTALEYCVRKPSTCHGVPFRRLTLPTSAGMVVELVANPMLTTIASSLPTKRAVRLSSSACIWSDPASARVLADARPCLRVDVSTASAHGPRFWAKPR